MGLNFNGDDPGLTDGIDDALIVEFRNGMILHIFPDIIHVFQILIFCNSCRRIMLISFSPKIRQDILQYFIFDPVRFQEFTIVVHQLKTNVQRSRIFGNNLSLCLILRFRRMQNASTENRDIR